MKKFVVENGKKYNVDEEFLRGRDLGILSVEDYDKLVIQEKKDEVTDEGHYLDLFYDKMKRLNEVEKGIYYLVSMEGEFISQSKMYEMIVE